MKRIITKISTIGIIPGLSKNEEKLIKLLNTICITWYCVVLFFAFHDYFVEPNFVEVVIWHFVQFFCLMIIQFIQFKNQYFIARFLFVITSFFHFLIFSNFIIESSLVEFYYLLIPLFSLLFLKRWYYHFGFLILSILAFSIPKLFFEFYDNSLFGDPITFPILFIVVFLLFYYFKNANVKNESLLKKQANEVLRDKELIEIQKGELEELNDFKNSFFINISHELRTPLTLIDGFASQALSVDENETKDKFISIIKDQSKKMTGIVTQILDLSKMKLNQFNLNLHEINVSQLITKSHASFMPLFTQKNLKFSLHIKENIKVQADPIYLERALNNIILNSLKYTDVGEVMLGVELNDEGVTILVADSGIGIKKEDQDKVFQEFYQVDNTINSAGGSGIGLSFSQKIIELHHGNLEVESEWGKGTKFSIHLSHREVVPNVIEQQEQLEELNHRIQFNEGNKTKFSLLIVEDHKEMMDYLALILTTEYQIFKAYDGQEALSIVNKEQIDFIITDYMMPKMNGNEFIKKLRGQGNNTPIIVLTARTDITTKLDTLRMGIDDYLYKPFNSDELLIKIENRLKNYNEAIIEAEIECNTFSKSSKFIADVSLFIDNNCHDTNFKVTDICNHFGYSESTLFRKIKTQTGLSPKGLIKEVKLLKARKLIEAKRATSIKELTLSVGIMNTSYLKKQYFERFGTSITNQIL